VPLSSYGMPYTVPEGKVDPSIDMKTAVRDQVNRMDAKAYFTLLAELMKTNPPAAADAPELAKFSRIGLVAGKDFDASKLEADFVKRIPEIAYDRILLQTKVNKAVKNINGWLFDTETGIYGTDYLNRALVTAIGLGANRIQDAVYPTSLKDVDGKEYNGANKYVMHFPKGQLPPARGFWSVTMYDANYFFVANPINRYSISARQNLKSNADGSVDLYIQNQSPGPDKETNWLPAPTGKFVLMIRLDWPDEKSPSIINGTWKPPAVQKVTGESVGARYVAKSTAICPLLAQSGHALLHRKCPLFGVKRTWPIAVQMSAFDAVDGASSAASKWYRMIASKPERFKEVRPGNEMAFEVFKELARTRRRNADTVDPGIGRTRLGQRTLKCVFLIGTRSAHSIRASGLTAAQTGRTHDRTRPMLQQRQKVLAKAPSTHDPKRTFAGSHQIFK